MVKATTDVSSKIKVHVETSLVIRETITKVKGCSSFSPRQLTSVDCKHAHEL